MRGDLIRFYERYPSKIVPILLISSYLYYIYGDSTPLSDAEYDKLCRILYDKWDEVTHPHLKLIDKEDLEAGSLYRLRDYPQMTICASRDWQRGRWDIRRLIKLVACKDWGIDEVPELEKLLRKK